MTILQTSNSFDDVLQRSALKRLSAVVSGASSALATPLGSSGLESHTRGEAWDRAVNRLIELGQAGGVIDEDDLEWPSREAISATLSWMQQLPSLPESILPDGEGGVAIERRSGQVTERIEVDKSGASEYLRFVDCKLVERKAL